MKPIAKGDARTAKRTSRRGKRHSSDAKMPRRKATKRRPASGIREAREARVLLEQQLYSLYWWAFNAYRIRGFLRAKGLDQAAIDENVVSEKVSPRDEEP